MAEPKYLQFVILKTGLEGSGARRRGKMAFNSHWLRLSPLLVLQLMHCKGETVKMALSDHAGLLEMYLVRLYLIILQMFALRKCLVTTLYST